MQKEITSQYLAALEMMKRVIDKCPDELWQNATFTNPFWHIAYHALFYVHLYAQPEEAAFVPWEKHRPNLNGFGPRPGHRMNRGNEANHSAAPKCWITWPFAKKKWLHKPACSIQKRPLVLIGFRSTSWNCNFITSATCNCTLANCASGYGLKLVLRLAG